VARRALALADRDGADALTIRKLAADLRVTPMALYWHFHSKEELLLGVTDQIWREIDTTVDESKPWEEELRGMFTSLLSVLREHPVGTELLLHSEKMHSEAAVTATEACLGVLYRGGFSPQDASAVARSTLWTAIMLVMAEPGREYPDPDVRAEMQRRHQVQLATLPIARFPHVVESAPYLTACTNSDEHFALGVEMFMAGVAALAGLRAPQQAVSPVPEG
jgi:AcrR family transcriptional regulator